MRTGTVIDTAGPLRLIEIQARVPTKDGGFFYLHRYIIQNTETGAVQGPFQKRAEAERLWRSVQAVAS